MINFKEKYTVITRLKNVTLLRRENKNLIIRNDQIKAIGYPNKVLDTEKKNFYFFLDNATSLSPEDKPNMSLLGFNVFISGEKETTFKPEVPFILLPNFLNPVKGIQLINRDDQEEANLSKIFDFGRRENYVDLKYGEPKNTEFLDVIKEALYSCAEKNGDTLDVDIIGLASSKPIYRFGDYAYETSTERNHYLSEGRRASIIDKFGFKVSENARVIATNKGQSLKLKLQSDGEDVIVENLTSDFKGKSVSKLLDDEFQRMVGFRFKSDSNTAAGKLKAHNEMEDIKKRYFGADYPNKNLSAVQEVFTRSVIIHIPEEQLAKCPI